MTLRASVWKVPSSEAFRLPPARSGRQGWQLYGWGWPRGLWNGPRKAHVVSVGARPGLRLPGVWVMRTGVQLGQREGPRLGWPLAMDELSVLALDRKN